MSFKIKVGEPEQRKKYRIIVLLMVFCMLIVFMIAVVNLDLENTSKPIEVILKISSTFAIFFFFGLVIFLAGYNNLRKKRLVEDTPTSRIRSIAMGFVELSGKAMPWKKLITSPLKEERGVCCFYAVGHYQKGNWRQVNSGVVGGQFHIQDSTGKVLVGAKDIQIDIPYEHEISLRSEKIPLRLKKLIDSNKFAKSVKKHAFKPFYKEVTLKKGDKIFIIGNAVDNPYKKEATAIKGVEDIMIQKGSDPFFISNKKEFDITKEFGAKARSLMITGGVIMFFPLATIVGLLLVLIGSLT
jgi:hypothetical protein